MSREQLVELAALDVFGLLDEYESALYTRSFHHAAAAVQDEILELQADIARDPVLAPELFPPDELRRQVLVAVSRAVEQDNSRLAPIASIGAHRVPPQPSRPASDRAGGRWSLFSGSGQFWRAAAFVLCGAVIVLAYFQTQRDLQYEELVKLVLNDVTQADLSSVDGLENISYFTKSPRRMSRTLRPQPNTGQPGIGLVVYVDRADDPTRASVLVVALGLPATGAYTLQARHADGEVEELSSFTSNGTVGAMQLADLSTTLLATLTLEVIDAAGQIVLTTA
jgi:hypothetical protein